ncbi:prolyl oligopeptidase family serine peptidase [Maribellus comscasis]|uniref:Prolyl oligopeptidase family serine peptidase n=1 Tax=Maribellus comscasis TaxID=2681766 RepID=A0A6I6JJZ4_9BACT|nr:alpha/beta hydrolase-fold protein [Maribellus comscasis]QGY42621.1 prolyl oligopeptidase family serine peptidase [Maribellus comscasis]
MKFYTIILVLLTFLCNRILAQNADKGYLYKIGIKDSVYSEILDENRDIWVHLPNGGKLNPNLKYPVVYILDGGVQLSALVAVYEYYWGNYLPKMILVGVSNQYNRTRDLTTSDIGNPNMKSGGAKHFAEFMEKELIPFVERKYPVTNYRTLIGHSYGGLFTINMLVNHPQSFRNYIAIDPSLDWDNQKFMNEAITRLKTQGFAGKSLFVSLASPLDRENENATIEEVLGNNSESSLVSRSKLLFIKAAEQVKENNHLNFLWKYYPDDIHATVPLPSILEGMRWLFDWYQLKDANVYNNPETLPEVLEKHITERAEVLSKHFGYPVPPADEEMLNMGGYMFLQTGQPEKAKLFFGLQVKYYPWSVNAFDSMADFYISQNDSKRAEESLRKAYELSGDIAFKKKIEQLKK